MANPASPVEAGNAKLGYAVADNGAGADQAALPRIVNPTLVDDETDESGALAVAAMTLHDAVDVAAEGPVKIGGVADSTRPAAVADGDRVNAAFDLQGGLQVLPVGGGGVAGIADDAPFTPGTNAVVMAGFEADESAPDSVDEGDAGAARMTLDRKQIVTARPHTSGGLTPYSAISTAAVLSAQIKGSAGQVYSMQGFSIDATAVYVRLYNQTGAPADTDNANIVWRGMVPTNGGFVLKFPSGLAFATGIGIRATTGITDTDTGALSASEVLVNVQYA